MIVKNTCFKQLRIETIQLKSQPEIMKVEINSNQTELKRWDFTAVA